MRLAFVTYAGLPAGTRDDALVIPLLQQAKHQIDIVVWNNPTVDWSRFDVAIIRSMWDYHLYVDAFHTWLYDLQAIGTRTINNASILRCHADKHYLHELQAKGVTIPQSRWFLKGAKINIADVLADMRLEKAVIKPTVSATAHKTVVATPETISETQNELDSILQSTGAIVQAFVPEIMTAGEWSLIFFGGEFSHAVVKRAKGNDFRVQDEWGGTIHPTTPPPELIVQAKQALDAAQVEVAYARVDGVWSDGHFILMELELIEPALYLEHDEHAPSRYRDALVTFISDQG